MFFFNGRMRNAHIVPMLTDNRPHTNKIDFLSIIAGCLLIIIGLTLICIGFISETEKTTFFGIGIISMCLGFCLSTITCFYTNLNICYHNWAYGQHITPSHMETSQLATAGDISISYYAEAPAMKQQVLKKTRSQSSSQRPIKIRSNVEINKVIIKPTIAIKRTPIVNSDDGT